MILEVTDDGTGLVTPSFIGKLVLVIIISLIRNVMSATSHEISEPSVHHSFIDREVDDEFLLTVVDSGKYRLVRLLLHNLYLLDHLGRKVLGSKLRIIEEESLAVNGDLGDGLTIRCDRSV